MLEQRKTYRGLMNFEEEVQSMQLNKLPLNYKLNQSIYLSRFGNFNSQIEEIRSGLKGSQQPELLASKQKVKDAVVQQDVFVRSRTPQKQFPEIVKKFLKNTKLSSPHKITQQKKSKNNQSFKFKWKSQIQQKQTKKNFIQKQTPNQFQLEAASKDFSNFRYFAASNQYKFAQRVFDKQTVRAQKQFRVVNFSLGTENKQNQQESKSSYSKSKEGVQRSLTKARFNASQCIRMLQQNLMKGQKTPFRKKIKVQELTKSCQTAQKYLQNQSVPISHIKISQPKQLFIRQGKQNSRQISLKQIKPYKNILKQTNFDLNKYKKNVVLQPAVSINQQIELEKRNQTLTNRRKLQQPLYHNIRCKDYHKQISQGSSLYKNSQKTKSHSQKCQYIKFQGPKFVKQLPNINMNSVQYDNSVLGWNQIRRKFLQKLSKTSKTVNINFNM